MSVDSRIENAYTYTFSPLYPRYTLDAPNKHHPFKEKWLKKAIQAYIIVS